MLHAPLIKYDEWEIQMNSSGCSIFSEHWMSNNNLIQLISGNWIACRKNWAYKKHVCRIVKYVRWKVLNTSLQTFLTHFNSSFICTSRQLQRLNHFDGKLISWYLILKQSSNIILFLCKYLKYLVIISAKKILHKKYTDEINPLCLVSIEDDEDVVDGREDSDDEEWWDVTIRNIFPLGEPHILMLVLTRLLSKFQFWMI